MIEGTYTAKITSASIEPGGLSEITMGTVILENGRVTGGDDYYSYEGKYECNDLKLTLEVSISQFRENPLKTLSTLTNFTVKLEGRRGFNRFELEGNVVEEPEKTIKVDLNKQ